MDDYCPAGPRLECRIGIEDSYGSCSCATVGLAEQVMRALLRREDPMITFSLSAMQMAARVVSGCHNVDEMTPT